MMAGLVSGVLLYISMNVQADANVRTNGVTSKKKKIIFTGVYIYVYVYWKENNNKKKRNGKKKK